MAALFKIGDRVQLVPPRAYINAADAWETDPATGSHVLPWSMLTTADTVSVG